MWTQFNILIMGSRNYFKKIFLNVILRVFFFFDLFITILPILLYFVNLEELKLTNFESITEHMTPSS